MDTLCALEALCDYALYKSTFTLHYIVIICQAQPALIECLNLSSCTSWTSEMHQKC